MAGKIHEGTLRDPTSHPRRDRDLAVALVGHAPARQAARVLLAPATRAGLAATFGLAAALLPGCVAGHPNPGCTGPLGIDGRPLPVCDGAGEVPVCDVPGTAGARYELNELDAWVLVDGTLAFCDAMDAVVCADRTLTPYCLFKPT